MLECAGFCHCRVRPEMTHRSLSTRPPVPRPLHARMARRALSLPLAPRAVRSQRELLLVSLLPSEPWGLPCDPAGTSSAEATVLVQGPRRGLRGHFGSSQPCRARGASCTRWLEARDLPNPRCTGRPARKSDRPEHRRCPGPEATSGETRARPAPENTDLWTEQSAWAHCLRRDEQDTPGTAEGAGRGGHTQP